MSSSAPRVIASATGNEGHLGGVFAVGDDDCELLDPLPTTGLSVSPDGTRLARLTWVVEHEDLSELLVSDGQGLLGYRRLTEVREAHSLMWAGDELHAVSTGSNSIVVLDEGGRVQRSWHPAGVPTDADRWHLNSLAVVDGRLVVSAFGRFEEVRGWSGEDALDGAGIVLDVETEQVVLSGLAAPHDPTWTGDGWLVCNSGSGDLWRLDADGRRTASVHLGGWTRGLLVDGDVIYVGISAHRLAAPAERARVAVLDGDTLREVARLETPCRDLFALVPYDEQLANGLRVGANLGAARGLGSPAVVMDDPLDPADSVVRLEVVAATASAVTVRVTNRSGAILTAYGTHPVRVGARWWNAAADDWVEVSRADLPAPLYPGRDTTVRLELPSLPPAGTALTLGVLQEMVRWFDEVSPDAAVEVHLPEPLRR